MHSKEIKENEKRFFDFVNQGDMKAVEKWIDEFVAEDFVNHSPLLNEPTGKD